MRISIIGAGYVGLVTGACLSELGHEVTVMDIDDKKIAKLNRGLMPIHEPGLSRLIEKNNLEGRLDFTANLEEAVAGAQIHFITVWTPPLPDGRADLGAVEAVARSLGQVWAKSRVDNPIVVIKSTVPVGTGDRVRSFISEAYQEPFAVVSNPEFLREGQAVADMMRPDRIIIGGENEEATRSVAALYDSIQTQKILTNLATAEMIKYAANAFLATKISFINEVANVCELVGADIDTVKEGIGSDPRIGRAFLSAGAGYGGSCFPKDVRALQQFANHRGYDFKLLKAVIEVNEQQRQLIVNKLKEHLKNLSNKEILVLGLAFKANTDDVRESAAIDIIKRLQKEGAKIRAYDPAALLNAQKHLAGDIKYAGHPHDGVKGVQAIVIATEWPEFKDLDWSYIRSQVANPLIIDGRNLLDAKLLRELGFTYEGVGRK
ncbi:MAG: UDP-glucose/GDP-mannose dehydrogenase family protein [Candidatus Komeilibacteria bacterium]|nr:UDP-glucose/GDP-mannose dehydrogenase family protein [Candidatus Komeilibacteria bacterium]